MNKPLGDRILIIGCAGSGKTTVANKLATKLNLPVVHLDTHYWLSHWRPINADVWYQQINKLCKEPKWIMDGNYTNSLPERMLYANTIVYLDAPRWLCLWRVFKRRFQFIKNRFRSDIPEGCKDRINYRFYKWIWDYPKRSKPETLAHLSQFNGAIYHIKSKKDLKHLFSQVNL